MRATLNPAAAELQTEPIIGWRVWSIVPWENLDGETEPRLAAAGGGWPWPPGRATEAVCISTEHHDAPNLEHACGAYALRTEKEARNLAGYSSGMSGEYAIGRVSLWGRVVEHKRGWRAQYAYPYAITVVGSEETARAVRDLYAVDVDRKRPTRRRPRKVLPRLANGILTEQDYLDAVGRAVDERTGYATGETIRRVLAETAGVDAETLTSQDVDRIGIALLQLARDERVQLLSPMDHRFDEHRYLPVGVAVTARLAFDLANGDDARRKKIVGRLNPTPADLVRALARAIGQEGTEYVRSRAVAEQLIGRVPQNNEVSSVAANLERLGHWDSGAAALVDKRGGDGITWGLSDLGKQAVLDFVGC